MRCTGAPVQRIVVNVHGNYQFIAGQYLTIVSPDGIDIPLSIASAPGRLPELELHYRSTPGAIEAEAMDKLLQGRQLALSAAEGGVHAGATDKPLLIVAGGSGAAQAFSCAEDRHANNAAHTRILWCADQAADLYDTDRLSSYTHGGLQVCVDDRRTAENEGLVWLREHAQEFAGYKIILAGSPGFVYAATDELLAAGISQAAMHADAYAYAPRPD